MTVSANMHYPAKVDGEPLPMPYDADLGRLSIEDRDGNRFVIFMPARVAAMMAHAYAVATRPEPEPQTLDVLLADEVAL